MYCNKKTVCENENICMLIYMCIGINTILQIWKENKMWIGRAPTKAKTIVLVVRDMHNIESIFI